MSTVTLALPERSTAVVVAALDRVVRRWLDPTDPLRREAGGALAATTGFAPTVVGDLIHDAFARLAAGELWRLLRQELGDPEALDRFVARPGGRGLTRAYGPRTTLVVPAGANPALAAGPVFVALLARSAVLCRVPAREPVFVPLLARSLAEAGPCLAAVTPTTWPADDPAATARVLAGVDAMVAYGSDDTIGRLRTAARPGTRVVEHGHRIGAALVTREALAGVGLAAVAAGAAAAVVVEDQLSCLSPQVLFVEGDAAPVAEAVAAALAHHAARQPLATLAPGAAAALRNHRYAEERREDLRGEVHVIGPPGAALDWLVVVDPTPSLHPGPGYRTLRVTPVADAAEVVELVDAARPLVGTVGLAAPPDRAAALLGGLGAAGVSRVCPLAAMVAAALADRMDGIPPLASLLRWVDVDHAHGLDSEEDTPCAG